MTTTQTTMRAFDENYYVGKRVVITGGTKGIGAAVASRLESVGSRVLTAARSAPETPSELFVQADVITPDGVRALAKSALELLGGVDIVVNNIGGSSSRPGGVLALTDEDWQADLNANLLAAVRLDRALLPSMIEQGTGVIIHVSSIQRRMPLNSTIAYAAAKAALSNIRIGKYAPGDRELAEESRRKGGRPLRYNTRKDKEYCSDNCRVKAHYHEVVKPRKQQRG